MTINDMVHILGASVLSGQDKLETPVYTAFCSDLMSDVLAFVNENTVLITGLINPQVIRTAEMLDLKCLVFARGKIPTEDVVRQAEELGIIVLATVQTSFNACGLLYEKGLRGLPLEWPKEE